MDDRNLRLKIVVEEASAGIRLPTTQLLFRSDEPNLKIVPRRRRLS